MKEEAMEAGRPNRRPFQSSEEENEIGLVVEKLRETKQGT